MYKKLLIASAVLVAAAGAHAQASSATFDMTGTVTPASCDITLTGGNVADYGVNESANLRKSTLGGTTNQHYVLISKSIPWTVSCTAATPLQLVFTDAKAGKALPFDTATDSYRFGLVDGTGTAAIGSFTVALTGVTIDGASAAGLLLGTAGLNSWNATNAGFAAPGKANGFIKTAGLTAPSTLTIVKGSADVVASLGKTYVDGSVSTITLNGGATITLQYL